MGGQQRNLTRLNIRQWCIYSTSSCIEIPLLFVINCLPHERKFLLWLRNNSITPLVIFTSEPYGYSHHYCYGLQLAVLSWGEEYARMPDEFNAHVYPAVVMNRSVTEGINSTSERDPFIVCIEKNFGKTIQDCSNCFNLAATPTWILVLHSIGSGAFILASSILCILVLVLVIRYKKLQRRAVIVSLSLIIADLLLVCSYHLPVFTSTIVLAWPFEFIGCQIFGFLSTTFIYTRWYMMSVLSADRFFTVRYPFSYEKYSKVSLTIMTLTAWIIPILISMTCLNILSSVAFRENVPTCLLYAPTLDRGLVFFSITSTLSFMIGCILPTALYVWLYCKARKLRPSATKLGRMSVQIAAGTVIQVPLGPLDRDKRERRALVTFILIFITFFLTSAPLFFFQILRSLFVDAWCKIPIYVHFIVIQVFLSSTLLDPILIMRDRDFRKCLKLFFSCHKCIEVDLDTAQFNVSENGYQSRRSDSVDIISYRGRRGSLCPSTGSASRMYYDTNHDSLTITVGSDTDPYHRRAQLTTLHEHLSEVTVTNSNGTCAVSLPEHQNHQAQDSASLGGHDQSVHDQSCDIDQNTNTNCEAIHNGVAHCPDAETINSSSEEVCSHWTITWCQPHSVQCTH